LPSAAHGEDGGADHEDHERVEGGGQACGERGREMAVQAGGATRIAKAKLREIERDPVSIATAKEKTS
jgi:hypothetical protein